MKNLKAINLLQLREIGIRSAMADHPIEHAQRYFADGRRWTR
jgi:hypothetical protein